MAKLKREERREKRKENCQHQVLVRMQSNWNSHALKVEIQNGTATLENSLLATYKVNHTLTM